MSIRKNALYNHKRKGRCRGDRFANARFRVKVIGRSVGGCVGETCKLAPKGGGDRAQITHYQSYVKEAKMDSRGRGFLSGTRCENYRFAMKEVRKPSGVGETESQRRKSQMQRCTASRPHRGERGSSIWCSERGSFESLQQCKGGKGEKAPSESRIPPVRALKWMKTRKA